MIVALRQCGSLGHRRGEVDDRAQSLGSPERIALLLKLGDWTSLVRASDPAAVRSRCGRMSSQNSS